MNKKNKNKKKQINISPRVLLFIFLAAVIGSAFLVYMLRANKSFLKTDLASCETPRPPYLSRFSCDERGMLTMSWLDGSVFGLTQYAPRIADTQDINNPDGNQGQTGTSFSSQGIPGHTYLGWVHGINSCGEWSAEAATTAEVKCSDQGLIYTISGKVSNTTPASIQGMLMECGEYSGVTAANGDYSIKVPEGYSCKVRPIPKTIVCGIAFTVVPSISEQVTINGASVSNINFNVDAWVDIPCIDTKYKCSGSSCVRDDANGTYTSSNCNNKCSASTPKYKCSGTSCVQDDANGTYTSSTCDGKCSASTPKYKCSGSSCVRDDASGTYTSSTCDGECSVATPKYKCSGSSCVRDDANGAYTSSTCDSKCGGDNCGDPPSGSLGSPASPAAVGLKCDSSGKLTLSWQDVSAWGYSGYLYAPRIADTQDMDNPDGNQGQTGTSFSSQGTPGHTYLGWVHGINSCGEWDQTPNESAMVQCEGGTTGSISGTFSLANGTYGGNARFVCYANLGGGKTKWYYSSSVSVTPSNPVTYKIENIPIGAVCEKIELYGGVWKDYGTFNPASYTNVTVDGNKTGYNFVFTFNNASSPPSTPKYKCSGLACIRDDVSGTYTTSNCDDKCSSAPASDCSDLGKDIADPKTQFDLSDIAELEKTYLKSGTGKDINDDGKFNYADVITLINCYNCRWDWAECGV